MMFSLISKQERQLFEQDRYFRQRAVELAEAYGVSTPETASPYLWPVTILEAMHSRLAALEKDIAKK